MWRAGETFEAYCDRRLVDAADDTRLYALLKRVEPELNQLPERPSPLAQHRLLDHLTSLSYPEALTYLRSYLREGWSPNELPPFLLVLVTNPERIEPMAAKLKVTVTLQQQHNPHFISKEADDASPVPEMDRQYKEKLDREGKDWRHPYLYLVVQLKNAMAPGIGEIISKSAVQALIDGGVDVTINPLK